MRGALPAWNPAGERLCAITPGLDSDVHLQCVDAAGEGRLDTIAALLDDQDRFWLLRSTSGEPSQRWEVLSPRGVPLHTLTLDAGLGLVAVRDDVASLRAERADGFQDALRCEVSPL